MDSATSPLRLALEASNKAAAEERVLEVKCRQMQLQIQSLQDAATGFFEERNFESFELLSQESDEVEEEYDRIYVRYVLKVEEAMILQKQVVKEEVARGVVHFANAEKLQFMMSSRRIKARATFWEKYVEEEHDQDRVSYMGYGIPGQLTPEVKGLYEGHIDNDNNEPSEWRQTVENYYNGAASSDSNESAVTHCQISGESILKIDREAAPIVPKSLDYAGMAKLIFHTGEPVIEWGRNGLLMHHRLKEWYKDHRFVIVPLNNNTFRRWRIDVISPMIIDEKFMTPNGEFVRVRDIDGKELTFATDQRPSPRNLCFRFIMCLLTIRDLGRPEWEKVWARYLEAKPFHGFPTVDRGYVSRQVLQALGGYFDVADTPMMEHWILDYSFYGHLLEKEQPFEIARRIHQAAFLECNPRSFRDHATPLIPRGVHCEEE